MPDSYENQDLQSEGTPEGIERAQTTAADVESAGRSCLVIVALALVTLGLIAIWVLFTAT